MTNKKNSFLSRFLLPIDGSEHCMKAVNFAGCLASGLGDRVEIATLLYVMAGHYLSRHMANVDVRVEHILKSDLLRRLKEQYLAESVEPILTEAEELMRRLGPKIPLEHKIVDGDPSEQILKMAENGGYTTIVMARRGRSKLKEVFLGSVTSTILHHIEHPTVYVVGNRILDQDECLLPTILIPLDGSPYSLAAVHEASVIARHYGNGLKKIILLHVINLDHYAGRTASGQKPESDAEQILNEGMDILSDTGVSRDRLEANAIYGRPVETIVQMAEDRKATLIMMGRRGRSALKDLFLGKVSDVVIHRCKEPNVAIVSGAG